MKKLIYLLTFMITFLSCKKEINSGYQCEPVVTTICTNDTILPSQYIMAYPGSWWEYDNGEIDSCIAWVQVPIREASGPEGCEIVDEETFILPSLTSQFGYIYSDKTVSNLGLHQSTSFAKILDEEIGIFYYTSYQEYSGQYYYTTTYTKEVFDTYDSLLVNGTYYFDVIHVKYSKVTDNGPPDLINDYWFSKNIGLIKWSRTGWGSTYGKELVNYHIEPY